MSVVALYIFDLALVKLSLGAIFLVWVLVHKLHNSKNQARDWREHFIWVSLGMFALAVDCDARFLFGWHALSALRPEHMGANLFFLGVTFALALAGKGHGRDLLALSSVLLSCVLVAIPFAVTGEEVLQESGMAVRSVPRRL